MGAKRVSEMSKGNYLGTTEAGRGKKKESGDIERLSGCEEKKGLHEGCEDQRT